MTLLGAPREVYRVYGEEEFFARVERGLSVGRGAGERMDAAPSAKGGRMLRRAASSTLLLAVIGVVGGLVAITGVPSSSRRGRRAGAPAGGTRLRAATGVGSLVASRAAGVQVWRAPGDRVDPGGPLAHQRQAARGQSVRRTATVTQRHVSRAGTLPASAAASASDVAAPAQSPPQGRAEFGFER